MASSISATSLNGPLDHCHPPSTMQADWGGRFSTAGASFCNSFANEDFAVQEPSEAARDQGSGTSG